MPTTTRQLRGLPPVFWWIWASLLVNWLGAFAGPMLAFSLTADRGYSASYTGLVLAFLGVGALLGNGTGGVCADRVGRRPTLIAGHCLSATSMLLLGFAQGRTAVAAAAFAVGAGAGIVRPAAGAALADVVAAEDRQRAFSLNYWAVNAGLAVSGTLAGLLAAHSYTVLFVADAATTALCALLVWAKVPETRPHTARGPGPRPLPGRTLRSDRLFLAFVVLTVVFAVAFEQRSGALAVVMAGQGHSPQLFGAVNALNALLVVTLQVPLTRLLARRSRARVLGAAGLLGGAGFGLNAFAHGAPVYLLAVGVWTLGEMLQAPAGSAVTAERAPRDHRGRYLGAYGAAWSVAAFIGPAAGGWCLDRFGPGTLWGGCVALGVLAGCGWLLIVGSESFRTATAVRGGGGTRPSPGNTEYETEHHSEHHFEHETEHETEYATNNLKGHVT
ncbi:MDR family MFS transporter [Streptomyces sp. NPDC050085]|uniref:MDR family MFS transporter n=1 Tax=Streptomyces sp. NPDC050085 TaxID=3365600 RepID=UPI003798297C